ncbi:MAG: SRPBCC family protein [Nitrolancea sp.]
MTTSTDRIEKTIVLNAPKSRVWNAISNANQFGEWFGVNMLGEFAAGATAVGQITTPGYEHLSMELFVDRIEPQDLFSYRWHPFAVDPNTDYSGEPTTLVEFRLAEVDGGTELTIVESGFDDIPLERRDEAFRMNEGGWTAQIANIERYVTA